MKTVRLCLLGIVTLFLTACTVGVSTNKSNSDITSTDSINNLTVTFDFNGGTYNDSSEQIIFDDVKPTSYWKYVRTRLNEEKITPPTIHQTFKGFSFAQDDPNIISDSYVVKENITVYAQYEVIPTKCCTVNWKDGETSKIIETETYFEGDTPTFKGTIPYHEGKTFDHWGNLRQIEPIDLGKIIDVTAVYVPSTAVHVVVLDYNDESVCEEHTQAVIHNSYVVKPKITREGYKLTNWTYTSGGEGEFNFATPITKDGIKIEANWVKATYIVTWLDYDGTVIKTEEVKDGEAPEKPSNPIRNPDPLIEYTFRDWSPAVSEEIHSDQIYVAMYQPHFYVHTEVYMRVIIGDEDKNFEFTWGGQSNITIDWGDETPQEQKSDKTVSHKYTAVGEYSIRIFNPITTISISSSDKTLIEELYLHKDITSIDTSTFSGCSNLQTVTFEEGSRLTSIGWYAFQDCSSLTSITIPNGVTSIGDYAFSGCSSLASIVIPSSVTSIGDYAFYSCSNLETVTFGAGSQLKSIGANAFRDCSVLTSITIPSSVTSIDNSAFRDCSNLQTVTFGDESKLTLIDAFLFLNCSSLTSITIPSGVTEIGFSVFQDCSSLTSINIPSGVTSIGDGAFEGCSSLTSITIPSSVTSIGRYAFDGCPDSIFNTYNDCKYLGNTDNQYLALIYGADKNVVINGNCRVIGDAAFDGCSSLASITIPSSVTSIGDYVFRDCSALTSITILSSVTSIGYSVFQGCSSLTSITIPSGVTSIGWYAFQDCSSLTSITIPSSVTSIGYNAFSGCSNLKLVDFTAYTISSIIPPFDNSIFRNCSSELKFHVASVEMKDKFMEQGWPEEKIVI